MYSDRISEKEHEDDEACTFRKISGHLWKISDVPVSCNKEKAPELKKITACSKFILQHSSEDSKKCDICGRIFTHEKGLLVHRRTHEDKKPQLYVCDHRGCHKGFEWISQLRAHKLEHTNEDFSSFGAAIVKKPYAHPKSHKGSSYSGKLKTQKRCSNAALPHFCSTEECTRPPKETTAVFSSFNLKCPTAKCDKCGEVYFGEELLRIHYQMDHAEVNQACDQSAQLDTHLKQHTSENLVTNLDQEVNQACDQSAQLDTHLQQHTSENLVANVAQEVHQACGLSIPLYPHLEQHANEYTLPSTIQVVLEAFQQAETHHLQEQRASKKLITNLAQGVDKIKLNSHANQGESS